MSNIKHTQGPWKLQHGIITSPHGLFITRDISNGDEYVARMDGSTHAAFETEANAKLIAASPEVIDALIGLLEIGKRDTTNPKYDGYWQSACDAVEKATGVKFSRP